MSCSMQALNRGGWKEPLHLYSETKITNLTGQKIDLVVAIYSLQQREFAKDSFLPDHKGNFSVSIAPCYTPEEAYVSLYGYQKGNPPILIGEKHFLYEEFFSKMNHGFKG